MLQCIRILESVVDNLLVDVDQYRRYHIHVLSIAPKFIVSIDQSRSPREGDIQQLMIGNSRSFVGVQSFGKLP